MKVFKKIRLAVLTILSKMYLSCKHTPKLLRTLSTFSQNNRTKVTQTLSVLKIYLSTFRKGKFRIHQSRFGWFSILGEGQLKKKYNCHDLKTVLGTFPAKGIFSRATSQMCNYPNGNFPKVRLGPLRHCRLQWGQNAAARMGQGAKYNGQNRLWAESCGQERLGKLLLGNLHIWDVATWENTLRKLPLEKNPFGKYLTSQQIQRNLFWWG